MPAAPGHKMVGTYVPAALAERFEAWARADGGKAAALRRLIVEAMDGGAGGLHGASPARSALAPVGVGRGKQVGIRLKDDERRALAEAAEQRGTSPANWVRSLAIVHLASKPQWNAAELEELRALFRELRAIGNNVNQIARTLNVAVQMGEYPPHQGLAAKEAAELVRAEMRRVVAVMTGNFDNWGLPDAERPTAAAGAVERADAAARMSEAARKRRPRRRPVRFDQGD
ncbi:plasmid mobilization relaxosome protein MobC [Phenylobacterium sp. LjRoot225]|uniref:plasmid mobilization protein n=1 Tax=Phenylobacterium sp. LjRoot225 TaxID=3342285 RepID=UPI003ECFC506